MGISVLRKINTRVVTVLGIGVLAFLLRLLAATCLPVDYDEDDYLRAAQQYAQVIRDGTWQRLPEVTFNREHPPLGKLAFGFVIAALPPTAEIPARDLTDPAARTLPQPHLSRARMLSAVFGALEVLLLAIIHPLAGLFLALHTFTLKYTSLVMLEALPALTSAAAVAAYERSRVYAGIGWNRWLALSAILLGLTASSKYAYGIVGLVILAHWLVTARSSLNRSRYTALLMVIRIVSWGLLAGWVFLATNPYLWFSPLEYLQYVLSYHLEFSQSFLVQVMHLPFFMPAAYLFQWAPGWVGLDPLIAGLAVLGFKRLWKSQPVYAIWIVIGLLFLFLWPTKWPQYVLVLTFPWSLAAAKGFETIDWDRLWQWLRGRH